LLHSTGFFFLFTTVKSGKNRVKRTQKAENHREMPYPREKKTCCLIPDGKIPTRF
jgi:hypothetical protein